MLRYFSVLLVVGLLIGCGQADEVPHVDFNKEPKREKEEDLHENVLDASDTPKESHFGDSVEVEEDSESCPHVQQEVCSELKMRAQQGIISWKEYHVLCEGPGREDFLCVPKEIDSGW